MVSPGSGVPLGSPQVQPSWERKPPMTISTLSPVILCTTPPAETGYSILLLAANVVPHMEVLVCWHILFLPEFQRQGQWPM